MQEYKIDSFLENLIVAYNSDDNFRYYLRDFCSEWDFFCDDPDDY